VPDEKWAKLPKELAGLIHQLPAAQNKLMLANSLANLSTEGDFGHDALKAVGTTLADTLSEQAAASKYGMPEQRYVELAQLIRYEHVQLAPNNAALLNTAMGKLRADDQRREQADFTVPICRGIPGHSNSFAARWYWSISGRHGALPAEKRCRIWMLSTSTLGNRAW
jgi:hypothetical protein